MVCPVSSLKSEHERELKVVKKIADLKMAEEQSLRIAVETKLSGLEKKAESLEARIARLVVELDAALAVKEKEKEKNK